MKKLNKTALLLIDMQSPFLERELSSKLKLIPHQIVLIRHCAENCIPIIVIEFNGEGKTIFPLSKELSKASSRTDIYTFKKDMDDAFENRELQKKLQILGIKKLILTGINAGHCVHATAISASRLGYKILTSENLIAGYIPDGIDKNHKERVVLWYKQNGKYVKDYKEFL